MNYEAIATWSQVISSLLFLVVLVYFWVRFIGPAVLAAQENTNRHIAETERHRDEAKAALDALAESIEGARRDAKAIVARADDQAAHESQASADEAREAGERALRNADGELDRARAAARDRLRTELLDRALDIARGQAERRVDGDVNARLVNNFLTSIEHRSES